MQRYKKIISAAALLFLLISIMPSESVFAEKQVTVTIDGRQIDFGEQPRLINQRTMVPMRKIYEELGADVRWVDEAQLIIATFKTSIIAMEIGKKSFDVTDLLTGESKEVLLDVPPQIVGIGTTLVPVRAISEALGKKVDWDDETWTVTISDIET